MLYKLGHITSLRSPSSSKFWYLPSPEGLAGAKFLFFTRESVSLVILDQNDQLVKQKLVGFMLSAQKAQARFDEAG